MLKAQVRPRAQFLAKRRRQTIACIGKHDAEAQACRHQAIDLFPCDLRSGARLEHVFRYTHFQRARWIAGPAFQPEKRQSPGTGTSSCESVGEISVLHWLSCRASRHIAGQTRRNVHRSWKGVSSITRNEPAPPTIPPMARQFSYQRLRVPNAVENEMVQTVVLALSQAGCHRLNAIALPDRSGRQCRAGTSCDACGARTAPQMAVKTGKVYFQI